MSLGYSRFAPSTPYDQFEGSEGGAAIQALIDATPAGGTLILPRRIYTLQTLVFRQPITVVIPDEGTRIYGSLGVRARPLSPIDPGFLQVDPSVRSSVQVIDLAQNFIYDWGSALPFTEPGGDWQGGFGCVSLAPPGLMCDDSQMELTRWPTPSGVNEPWTFEQLNDATPSNSVFTDTGLPTWSAENWSGNNRSAITLYPWYVGGTASEAYDYYTSAEISYPSGTPTVTLDHAIPNLTAPICFDGPYGALQQHTRYVVQNVLEELLLAGQYYIDVNNLRIYFIPPAAATSFSVYRIPWSTVPLVQLYADSNGSCSGISFAGGPLGFYGCRSNAIYAPSNLAAISFANIQAYGIGMDAFFFQQSGPQGDWSVGTLVVEWCGGAGMWFGPSGGTSEGAGNTIPELGPWNSSFGEIYLSQTCQWTRTYRGGLHMNCVGCSIGFITSIQNPAHHLLHDSHDFVVNGGYFDATFMEAADVGVINSGGDPTIFGTAFNNITIVNIPDISVYRVGATTGRTGIYIDNTGCGVIVNNATFSDCASTTGYCIYVHGGQACVIDGVTTLGCACPPVVIGSTGSSPWTLPNGFAIQFFKVANAVDPRYQTKYGDAWNQLTSVDGGLGAPRNNSVLNIFVYTGSTAQPDLNTIGLGVPVDQPQGAVGAAPFPVAPYPRPT